MGCPFHNEDEPSGGGDEPADRSSPSDGGRGSGGIDRRSFVKSALAIGGTSALTRLETVAGIAPRTSAEEQTAISAQARLNRQHAWDAFEATVATGNTAPPLNSLFLCMNYRPGGEPTPGHRRRVETALSEIERNFEWSSAGVMFTMAYSAEYFDRFDEELPPGAAPLPPGEVATLAETVTTDDTVEPDTHDAVLLLSSNNAANLLAVEAALWGETNDRELVFEETFEGIFEKPQSFPDRRVGAIGADLPKDEYREQLDVDIPSFAPLSMGFIAGFGASIPEEDAVTLREGQRFPNPDVDASVVPDEPYVGEVGERDPGIFAQGTLKHLSHIKLDLDSWYNKPKSDRQRQMYSPFHTDEDVGQVGENLANRPGGEPGAASGGDGEAVPDLPARSTTEQDYAELAKETADSGTTLTDDTPTLGHSQKAARARYDVDGDGELEQPVLRRDWDGLTELSQTSTTYHFNVPMRFNESAFSMFDANYNLEFTSLDGGIDHGPVDTDQWKDRNGIAPFMEATFRGHFLVPPITLRALPTPQPEQVAVSAEQDADQYVVTVTEVNGTESGGSDGDGGNGDSGSGGDPGNGGGAPGNGGGPPEEGGGPGNGGGPPEEGGGPGNGGGPPEEGGGPGNGGGGSGGNGSPGNAGGADTTDAGGASGTVVGRIDHETVRCGSPRTVNQAGGATPVETSRQGNAVEYRFDAGELDPDGELKLFAKRTGDGIPIVGRTTL